MWPGEWLTETIGHMLVAFGSWLLVCNFHPAGLVVVAIGESLVVAAHVIGWLIDWLFSIGQ
jgi:hypothetical protein